MNTSPDQSDNTKETEPSKTNIPLLSVESSQKQTITIPRLYDLLGIGGDVLILDPQQTKACWLDSYVDDEGVYRFRPDYSVYPSGWHETHGRGRYCLTATINFGSDGDSEQSYVANPWSAFYIPTNDTSCCLKEPWNGGDMD